MTRPLTSLIAFCFGSCQCHGIGWHAKEVAA